MGNLLRLEFSGAVYHITSRSWSDRNFDHKQIDKSEFLHLLYQACRRFHWQCYAYCLLDDHYHLLLKTHEPNLRKGMRFLDASFIRVQGGQTSTSELKSEPFQFVLVEQGRQVMLLARYIVLNPVRLGYVAVPEQWAWSSHLSLLGANMCPRCIGRSELLSYFGVNVGSAVAVSRYKQFVIQGIGLPSPLVHLKHNLVLGSDRYLAEVLACAEIDLELNQGEEMKAELKPPQDKVRQKVELKKKDQDSKSNIVSLDRYRKLPPKLPEK